MQLPLNSVLQTQYNEVKAAHGSKFAYRTVYLQSDHWKELRSQILNRDNHQCILCQKETDLQVHHRTYARLFQEKLSDLVTLCRACHEETHRHGKISQPKLRVDTTPFVPKKWSVCELKGLTQRPKGCPKKLWKQAHPPKRKAKPSKRQKSFQKNNPVSWNNRLKQIQREIDAKRKRSL